MILPVDEGFTEERGEGRAEDEGKGAKHALDDIA